MFLFKTCFLIYKKVHVHEESGLDKEISSFQGKSPTELMFMAFNFHVEGGLAVSFLIL